MDTSDPEISFNIDGICNHCERYDNIIESRVYKGEIAQKQLNNIVKSIRKKGKGNEYNCIIGVSGGVDSTYVAYLTNKLGLRPLAIHFDNGWNSELAVGNIEKILDKLGIDLYTYVINWDIFSDLQKAFLKASTPDGEVPTDHAIAALLFREANRRNIKYIISGMNFATESMSVRMWSYGHSDWKYIRDIYRTNGNNNSLKVYPHYNFIDLFYWTFIKKIKVVSILNYIDYDKKEAMEILKEKLDWIKYKGKHYESIYTRFYQGYILPTKFGIDKRIGHLSDLIRAKQISRSNALNEIKAPPYPSEDLLAIDMDYVKKKFNYSDEEFNEIMNLPLKNFKSYKNQADIVEKLKNIVNFLRRHNIYSK
jgi:N-acetyl sugar amidotransferase